MLCAWEHRAICVHTPWLPHVTLELSKQRAVWHGGNSCVCCMRMLSCRLCHANSERTSLRHVLCGLNASMFAQCSLRLWCGRMRRLNAPCMTVRRQARCHCCWSIDHPVHNCISTGGCTANAVGGGWTHSLCVQSQLVVWAHEPSETQRVLLIVARKDAVATVVAHVHGVFLHCGLVVLAQSLAETLLS
jgi:hypothetical protein